MLQRARTIYPTRLNAPVERRTDRRSPIKWYRRGPRWEPAFVRPPRWEEEEEEDGLSGTRWWVHGGAARQRARSHAFLVTRCISRHSALGTRHTQPLRPPPTPHPPPEPWTLEHRAPSTQRTPTGAILPPLDANLRGMMMSSSTHEHHEHQTPRTSNTTTTTTTIKHIIRSSFEEAEEESTCPPPAIATKTSLGRFGPRGERLPTPTDHGSVRPRKLSRGNPAEIPSSPRSHE